MIGLITNAIFEMNRRTLFKRLAALTVTAVVAPEAIANSIATKSQGPGPGLYEFMKDQQYVEFCVPLTRMNLSFEVTDAHWRSVNPDYVPPKVNWRFPHVRKQYIKPYVHKSLEEIVNGK